MLRRSLAIVVAVSALLIALAGPVSAAGPTPPNCWGVFSNDGQTAATALSSIGANGQPGLSAFNQGGVAAFVQYLQSAGSGCQF
jgi:uncharacterized protein YidB (DUF937 family)